jgi:HlyD family secretion protein
MSKPLSHYLFTLAVPLALAAAGLSWMFGLPGQTTDTIAYETGEVTRGTIRKIVSTSGPVRALVTVQVGSQLSGQIQELKADFNTEVKAGDVMAVLDAKTYVARVASAKADLAMAQAGLVNQTAALEKGNAVLRQAERATGRQQALATKGVTSGVAVDTAQRDADVARAEIAVTQALIENAKAQIAQRQAQLDQALIDLDRTTVRSPIDGTVIARTVDVGQTVAASLQAPELFKIAQDLNRIRIEAQVNEADVGAVAQGNAVTFTVDAYPDRRFEGRVTQVRLAATELNNVVTYPVIIEADNPERKLFPGMTANAQVESARKDNALRIPVDALRFKPREGTVPQIDQGEQRREQMLERLSVELGLTTDQKSKVADEMKAVAAEFKAKSPQPSANPTFGAQPKQSAPGGGGGAGGEEGRSRFTERLERILAQVITPAQRPAFDKWKASREQRSGRPQVRSVPIWLLTAAGTLESRNVRVGLADDQFAEVLGQSIKEGDKVVVRTKMTVKK